MSQPWSRAATTTELAVLHHPDQRCSWVVLLAVDLAQPITVTSMTERLQALHEQHEVIGARLAGERWVRGGAPTVAITAADPLDGLDAPFHLATEAPLRVALAADGSRLGIAAHHAALDGRGVLSIAAALCEWPPTVLRAPAPTPTPSRDDRWRSRRALVRRALAPAQRVGAPGTFGAIDQRGAEARAARTFSPRSPDATAHLAAAGAAALGLRRTGITIGIAGQPGIGNFATYRRVDVGRGDDVVDHVRAALGSTIEPPELRRPRRVPAALLPLVDRLSDTIVVSNLGRVLAPGAVAIEFYPVARGRSAVAFGAAGIEGGASTLTIRAAHLSPVDAEALLEDVVMRCARAAGVGTAPDAWPQ